METHTNNEFEVNEGVNDLTPPQGFAQPGIDNTDNRPKRKKYHSSAMYAASMWHNTVKHVKPPHAGGGLLPLQP